MTKPEMSAQEALAVGAKALERGYGHGPDDYPTADDLAAGAVLRRLAPFVEAAMAYCEYYVSRTVMLDAGSPPFVGMITAYRAMKEQEEGKDGE